MFPVEARRAAVASVAFALVFGQLLVVGVGAAGATTKYTLQRSHLLGTTQPSKVGAKRDYPTSSIEFIPDHEPNSKTIRHTYAAGAPRVNTTPVVAGQVSGFAGFDGLNHKDQRNAGTPGTKYENSQFSLEPPDQALCVGLCDDFEVLVGRS